MIDARTMSKKPARSATSAMINSGAFPKVALSRPPMASPVRVASCSVDITISRAIGRMARPAQKNSTGAGTCAYSSATETGMKTNIQLIDGFRERGISGFGSGSLFVEADHDREEERGRPSAHQDAGQRFHAAAQPPVARQQHVAIAGGGVGDSAEVEGRLRIRDRAIEEVGQSPH